MTYYRNIDFDGPMWRLVRELYLDDKVVEAFKESQNLGGSRSDNDLFAETEARIRGRQHAVRPWLTVEAIRDEIGDNLPAVLEVVGRECDDLSQRFGWNHKESTFVALLPVDVEESWMPGRWGYFVDKVPYDKICLPHHLASDLPDLSRTIRHEFMHVITHNLSGGNATRWLAEAMSTYAERYFDRRHWDAVRSGEIRWLSPLDISVAAGQDNRDQALRGSINQGYSQSNLIARYLASQGGDTKLSQFLRALGDDSFLPSFEEHVLGRNPMHMALRKVYGISEKELFENAFEWVRSSHPSSG